MSKYKTVDEPVFITGCSLGPSKHGGDIWTIRFKGIKTQKDYHTYVDPANKNFRHWDHIISIANLKGIVITNTKLKNGDDQINADSKPHIEVITSQEDLANQLAEHWYGKTNIKDITDDDDE